MTPTYDTTVSIVSTAVKHLNLAVAVSPFGTNGSFEPKVELGHVWAPVPSPNADTYAVTVLLRLFGFKEGTPLFSIEVGVEQIVVLKGDTDVCLRMLENDLARGVVPYARAHVATLLQASGYPGWVLPPLEIAKGDKTRQAILAKAPTAEEPSLGGTAK